MTKINMNKSLHGFTVTGIEDVAEIRSQVRMFRHRKTGARVLHMHNDDPNNLFALAFRTPVWNDTGVPHILEHSVLSGSRRFPLKDPFQYLLRSSLQTFLNALTYPDKTVYPASSQVEKDFFNLFDVYCDAVFHPLLTRETFLQEGWHFAVSDMDKPIDISGIVYNEMKGVFSEFSNHVMRKTMSSLFPDTVYRHESGGEPLHITELTHEQLLDYHSRYYHPSNAYIVLYGNIPSEKSLAFLNDRYLDEFNSREVASAIEPQKPWHCPAHIEFDAPGTREDDGLATVAVNWLYGSSLDPMNRIEGKIVSRYLLDTEGSPLRRALIDSGLGEDLAEISGFESELVQNTFAAGLRKANPEACDRITETIYRVLEDQASGNFDAALLEGALRQQEFRLREVEDNGFLPYNLMLAERCFASWIYDGDPLMHLRFSGTIETLKNRLVKEPGYFESIIRERFLDNRHYLVSVVRASSKKGEELARQTRAHVGRLTKDFDSSQKARLYETTKKLSAYQSAPPSSDALASLPQLTMEDLPRKNRVTPAEETTVNGAKMYLHPLSTSGIVYLDCGFDVTGLDKQGLLLLPLLTEVLTRCGAAGYDSAQMATRISRATGGVSSSIHAEARCDGGGTPVISCMVHIKSLQERIDDAQQIVTDVLSAPKLEDPKLVKDCLYEMRNDMSNSIISNGHSYALRHAAAKLDATAWVHECTDGITQLRFLDELLVQDDMESLIVGLKSLFTSCVTQEGLFFSITAEEPRYYLTHVERIARCLPQGPGTGTASGFSQQPRLRIHGIEINSSVNFVARAQVLEALSPQRMANALVLSRILSTGYLWQSIRMEGGAYGGFSRYGFSQPVFCFGSYRDPHITRTLDAYDKSLQDVRRHLDAGTLQQNIMGAIGKIDTPRTPHSQGLRETLNRVRGFFPDYRQAIRDAVLSSNIERIREIAGALGDQRNGAVTVLGNRGALDAAQKENVAFQRQTLLETNRAEKK